MKKTIALLLLVFPLLCISQINYEPGYFIENGVKTECLIKNMGWKYTPVSISYKLNENEDSKTKTIKEISEFMVSDNYRYKKFTVNIDRSASTTEFLLSERAPQWNQEVVFLKLLVSGELSLYQYEESNLVRYFYSTDDTNVEQLVYKKFMRNSKIAENNMYRQQLYNLMKNQGYTAEKFEKTNYLEDDLVKIFTEYNGAKTGKVVNLSEKRNKPYFNIRITPGIAFNSFSMQNSTLKLDLDFSQKASFRIGAEVEYVMSFNKNKWSIFVEPYYCSYSNETAKDKAEGEIDYKYIGIPIGLRHYMYLNQNSKFFIDAAYNVSVSMGDSEINYYNYNVFNSNKTSIPTTGGYLVGIGYGYKRYSAAIRYSNTSSLLRGGAWDTSYSSIGIILGYKIL